MKNRRRTFFSTAAPARCAGLSVLMFTGVGALIAIPGMAAPILPVAQTSVQCAVDSARIQNPASCTLGGSGTAVASLTLAPFASLVAEATSPANDVFGIHGSSANASVLYSFQVTGGNPGDIVPILIATSLTSRGSDPTHGIGFAQLAVHTGAAGDSFVAVCSDGTCGTTATSFSGTLRTRARSGDLSDTVFLQAQASTGDSSRAESARASADPFIFVDPAFTNASLYSIVVSQGVGNSSAAVPEPGTTALVIFGGLALAFRRRSYALPGKLKMKLLMASRIPLLPHLAVLLWAGLVLADPALAIVNGTEAGNPQFQAVVSVGGCTGTFIHPRFILTAAHCIRRCSGATDTGCVTGSPIDVVNGAAGHDGPVSMTARDGITPGSGTGYAIDFVYFPRAADTQRGRPTDNALLRTTTPFAGKVIPVFPHQDRPQPNESNYCPRWEFTWPSVLGFSNNAGSVDARRRVGRAFAECDLELFQSTFKLDGHGRPGQRGMRLCRGDSGGPVLWPTGFGGFAIGGVNSATDDLRAITDTRCPSERGEGFHAFIPAAFLDRVAQTDTICAGSSSWERCPGVPAPYGGFELRYRGTEIDQCGRDSLFISSVHGPVPVERGSAASAEVAGARFGWFCGGSQEATTAKDGVNFVVAKRGLTDRQIIWDTYEIIARPPQPPPPPTSQLTFSDTTLDFGQVPIGEPQSLTLVVRNSTGRSVSIQAPERSGTFAWDLFAVSLLNNTERKITVEFTPQKQGNATGVLIITSNSPGSPHRISLRGFGVRGVSEP